MSVQLPVPGAALATDVRLPAGAGPFPAVVLRTPYDRRGHRGEARAWAAHGFAAVVQDVRGRHASGGAWHPYRHEAGDGADTLRWIRAQPWSDGRVIAVGASYAAYCALVTAVPGAEPAPPATTGAPAPAASVPRPAAAPDGVIAAVPAVGPAAVAREPSGVERLLGRAGWWAAHGDRAGSDPAALGKALADDPRLLEHLPVSALPERLGRPLPSWADVWTPAAPDRTPWAYGRVPLLAVGGTRDPFAADTLALWRNWGGPARLVLGPWGHGLTAEPAPEARPGHRTDLGRLYVRWARAALTPTGRPGAHGAVALGGSEHWYPVTPQDTAPDTGTALPFVSSGSGTGPRLLRGRDFTADPDRPMRSDRLDTDPRAHPDRALLLTPPLPRPLDLLGPACARLRVAADTPAADWFVRLVALDPRGRAEPLALGTARRTDPPGTPVTFTVPLGFLARRLGAGTRLRVEIGGHHFPAHARNPHTGDDPTTATRLRPSRRTLHTDGSALLLPVRTGRRPLTDPLQEIRT
ncbi:CocE/NonD family hydrolase [Streptomyces uncialis]|uniref:CocE/NonD family hydrolase n=1 Tax=Streptomyces uncialis TaxID=1048205 RepID=UPI002255A8CF|nr:CocE/NonD family hydrolase [Streptomyces uncialis]MCX4662226.1 CocE/NonD family hydrolase [Streptomyces uncialis]